MAETPDLGTLLAGIVDFVRGSIDVAIPAQVLSYNPALQSVTVKPVVSGRFHDPTTNSLIPFTQPPIANVPVQFPSAPGYGVTFPIAVGSTGLLVISDRSLDEWKSAGLAENVPVDTRRFDQTDAVFIPGVNPFSKPIPPTGWSASALVVEGPQVLLGSSAAVAPVALAPLVSAALAALGTWLTTHTHTGVTTGVGVSGPPAPPPPSAGNLGAIRVKAE